MRACRKSDVCTTALLILSYRLVSYSGNSSLSDHTIAFTPSIDGRDRSNFAESFVGVSTFDETRFVRCRAFPSRGRGSHAKLRSVRIAQPPL